MCQSCQNIPSALAGVAQWLDHLPVPKGCGFDFLLGHIPRLRVHPQSRRWCMRPLVHATPGPDVYDPGPGTDPRSWCPGGRPIDASLASTVWSLPSSLSLKKQMKMSPGEDKNICISSKQLHGSWCWCPKPILFSCKSCATQVVYLWTSYLLLAHSQGFDFMWTLSPTLCPRHILCFLVS